MLKRKEKEDEKFLDVDASMKGSLYFSDPVNLRINGHFEGNLNTKGKLIIGQQAIVDADIIGEEISVSGKIKGMIKATKKLVFSSTAHVQGDIESPKFSMEEGAFFTGNCKMGPNKMSLVELANYLALEQDMIKDWVKEGKIPVERLGEDLVFDPQEVDIWIKRNA